MTNTRMKKSRITPTLMCDFYKLAHRAAYPENTETIYTVLLSRTNKYMPNADRTVVLGIQGFLSEFLIDYFNENFFDLPIEDVVAEYERLVKYTLGEQHADATHIKELHALGYLPLKISAIEEGESVPVQVPIITVENTHPSFFWLPNFLETLLSAELWQPMTSASIARTYRKLLESFALKTTGSTEGVDFQAHDFSMRGMSSTKTSMLSGLGHLVYFTGTDTIPAIMYAESYYNANVENELVGTSIPATEHSVMCANTPADGDSLDEYEAYRRIIQDVYPTGFVSLVSDTYDFWHVVSETLPKLKPTIMSRDGKVVIRPDSGNPTDILCGANIEDLDANPYVETFEEAKDYMKDGIETDMIEKTPHGEYGDDKSSQMFKFDGKYYNMTVQFEWNRYDKQYYYVETSSIKSVEEIQPTPEQLGLIECLWNTFGGEVNEQGYKVLDSHIGAIYGDSITYDRAKAILSRLEEKGFASLNIVFGVGSYTYQYNTRDSLGFAMKATHTTTKEGEHLLYKDPKTDTGKRSPRGKMYVTKDEQGNYTSRDGLYNKDLEKLEAEKPNELKLAFENGKLVRETSLAEIRNRASKFI